MTDRNYENEYWEAQAHINELEGEGKVLIGMLVEALLPKLKKYFVLLTESADDNPETA